MLFVSVVLLALIFSSCGVEERHGKTITLTSDKLEMVSDEYLFDPETIHAKPGRVQVRLRNIGTLNHNLKFFRGEKVLGELQLLAPKEVSDTTIDLEPGTYEMICTVGDHEALGMSGEIIVK